MLQLCVRLFFNPDKEVCSRMKVIRRGPSLDIPFEHKPDHSLLIAEALLILVIGEVSTNQVNAE